MRSILKKPPLSYRLFIAGFCLLFMLVGLMVTTGRAQAASQLQPTSGKRLITIHDNGQDKAILTEDSTLRQAFKDAHIRIDASDMVEPGLDDVLVASNYEVNIYRARPVTIIDGAIRERVMSAYRTAEQIVSHAGMLLHDEDRTSMGITTNMVSDGAGVQLTIERATPVIFVLYGKKTPSYTQATTVGDMLKEKGITLAKNDTLSVALSTRIVPNIKIELWRNGTQTFTDEQDVPFDTEQIQDADQPVGYKLIKTTGVNGKRTVTYEIVMKNGHEVSRKEIQSVVTAKPSSQVEVIGTKADLPPGSHEDWMAAAGMDPSNYGYINYIFTGESHWTPSAENPYGYVGLGQTNRSSLSSACPNWQTDPICQIRFFDGYVHSHGYGTWETAYNHWVAARSW